MGSGSRYYFNCAAGGNLVYIFVCTQKCISWHHSYLLPKTAIHLFFATSVMKSYDLLIVGSGLYGAVIAQQAKEHGMKCLVLERRQQVGGNIRDEWTEGICVHQYGAHIFHTDSEKVWRYVNRFATFVPYHHTVMARVGKRMYHLPFSLQTFYDIYGVSYPHEIDDILQEEHKREYYPHPSNLEEQAVNLIGRTVYDLLVRGYTEKQWGCRATDLPPDIIRRLPIRRSWQCGYFDDRYQGLPLQGYSAMIREMLTGIEVRTSVDFTDDIGYWVRQAKTVVYTGMVDELMHFEFGPLGYRSLCFENETIVGVADYQGIAVVNEVDKDIPYTRIIEHRHLTPNFRVQSTPQTIITREYPQIWSRGMEAYYPVNNEKNAELYQEYRNLMAVKYSSIHIGGRLGDYKYYDMDDTIVAAQDMAAHLVQQLR